MTLEEVEILDSEAVKRRLFDLREEPPDRVALHAREYGALLATQVKYLQRARTKLPSYYRAGCIIPPLAFEQSSSEDVARRRRYAGDLCVDLTCGLGVDAYILSRRFKRVIAVERDPVTARVAEINFGRLGADNMEVVCDTAERFIDAFAGRADLFYIDPARRDGTRKVFLLEDCSPNLLGLLPELLKKGKSVVAKLSPMFDVEETFRIFGDVASVEVMSLRGECKEVLVRVSSDPEPESGTIRVSRSEEDSLLFDRSGQQAEAEAFEPPYVWFGVPDVGLGKARLVGRYAARLGAFATSPSGYCLFRSEPEHFFGRLFPLRESIPYHPKSLRRRLKDLSIVRCEVMKKEFPYSVETILRSLGVREGGSDKIAFTKIGTEPYVFLLGPERLNGKGNDNGKEE
ncbi:MAG TPA: SAM-dependent methyltransferase [Candidatus Alistipes merdigallinarum]|nr:SAM-dependent methyltransferase [Candidatus Alistipes merdigallinarum]